VDIDLVNPTDVSVTFSRIGGNVAFFPAYKAVFEGIKKFAYDAKLISSPDFEALDLGKNQVMAGANETIDVLTSNQKTDITVIACVRDRWDIRKKTDPLLNAVLGKEKEACLYLNGGNYYFGIGSSEEYISLASMVGVHIYKKEGEKRKDYYTIGFADFFNIQYFNDENPTDGLVIAPSDALYPELLKHIIKTARFTNTSSRKQFWPVYYDSKNYFSPPYYDSYEPYYIPY